MRNFIKQMWLKNNLTDFYFSVRIKCTNLNKSDEREGV